MFVEVVHQLVRRAHVLESANLWNPLVAGVPFFAFPTFVAAILVGQEQDLGTCRGIHHECDVRAFDPRQVPDEFVLVKGQVVARVD